MSVDDFKAWLVQMGGGRPIPDTKAAELLGIKRHTVAGYRSYYPAPRRIALACSALLFGLPAFRRAA